MNEDRDPDPLVFCACVFEMFIRNDWCYPENYTLDRFALFGAAFRWVQRHNALYNAKMTEIAYTLPIGSEFSPFVYEQYFNERDLRAFKTWTGVFLNSLPGVIDAVHMSKRRLNHIMQKTCEYLNTEYITHQPAIECTLIETRLQYRRGEDTEEEREADTARLLHLSDLVLGTECHICSEVSELLTACENGHDICRNCLANPLLQTCPFCRGVLLGSSP